MSCFCELFNPKPMYQQKERQQKENDITILDVAYTSDIMGIRSAVIGAAFVAVMFELPHWLL